VQGVFGNADLEPQRTVMYELGLQQQLGEQLGFNVTGFYRDVRNWISTSPPIPTAIAGVSYVRYINKDYANVRGLTFSLERRHADHFSFSLAYTYQVAEGNNSNPEDEFFAALANAEPTKQLTPLDWDQRHTLNALVSVGTDRWGVGLIGRYGSGLPYSPAITVATRQGLNLSTELIKNSRRRPATMTVDLRAHYAVVIAGMQSSVFLRVFNLLDRRNELNIFNDTGRATYTLQTRNIADTPDRHNTVAEYFTMPHFYSPPREVQIGMSVSF
jgi:outer membrane cobalamin receptor